MTETDRRHPNAPRVSLSTLVDVCVPGGAGSPFQGETSNLSGRGMQVRTSHLPNIGEQLVCRFEHSGQEVLVEGRVAWRSEGEDSGEFGVQFTALDASSAELLKELGKRPSSNKGSSARLFSLEDEEPEERLAVGSKVRLHIDGLPSPMKARVVDGSERRVKVGSSLEFLKVGRPLSVEALDGSTPLGAFVDSVNVVLNPSTAVPELVVMLRYEGASPTPPPAQAKTRTSEKFATSPLGFDDEDEDEFLTSHGDHDSPAGLPPAARVLADKTGDALRQLGAGATKGVSLLSRALKSAAAEAADFAKKRRAEPPAPRTTRRDARPVEEAPRRRTTSPPRPLPSSLTSAGIVSKRRLDSDPELRAKATIAPPVTPGVLANPAARRWAILGGAFAVLMGGALVTRGMGSNASESAGAATVAASPRNPSPEVALSAQSPLAAASSTASAAVSAAPPTTPEGIVAEVPLFGPRAMATAEAVGKPPVTDAEAERLAAESLVEVPESEAPKEVKPWGKGRLLEPVLHRIRLDGAGSAIDGGTTKNGFSVLVPGRKALESGRTIEKRDRRVSVVKTSNTARGAQLQLEFKGPVPAYRVRLRGEYLEVLISASEVGVAKL